MDTKSKRSGAFRLWLYLFIGINIIALFSAYVFSEKHNWVHGTSNILGMDYKDTQAFKYILGDRFDFLAKYITYEEKYSGLTDDDKKNSSPGSDQNSVGNGIGNEPEDNDTLIDEESIEEMERFREEMYWGIQSLNEEGNNLLYYAHNPKLGIALTNFDADSNILGKDLPILPEGYNFYIYYDGDRFKAQKDGKPLDLYSRDLEYWNTSLGEYIGEFWNKAAPRLTAPDIRGCRILLVVKKDIVRTPYRYSSMYQEKKYLDKMKHWYLAFLASSVLGVGLFVFSVVRKELKQEFDDIVIRIMGKTVLEIKILASVIMLITINNIIYVNSRPPMYITMISILLAFWWLYPLWLDIRTRGKDILKNSIAKRIAENRRRYRRNFPFKKVQMSRFRFIVIAEIILAIITVWILAVGMTNGETWLLAPALILAGVGLILLFWYRRRFARTLDDIGIIIDQTQRIRQGDMDTKLELNPDPDLFKLGDNLNAIQEGIAVAVENSLRNEKMKVELITNVSHDLKTPLTSIISYADLLSKEEELPDHVKDYIKVLSQKSERLKFLIQDLFDLSKVVSGNMEFEMKTLDLGKLIEQTLGDLEDRIRESGLTFRVNLPDDPVLIISDGNKLYRVFLNLFQNALKYSMKGTRVYVDLEVEGNKATATIKNTANYEMNFGKEEITERFVRGDKSRTGEGSGLGLAIAQNFTKSCGGKFDIKVDGDLFKVIISFDERASKKRP